MKTEKILDTELSSGEVNGVPFSKIEEILRKPLKIRDTWYVLCRRWYDGFRAHTGLEVDYHICRDHPGPIDNSPIIDCDNDDLKEHLIEDTDYVIIPEEMWTLLVSWYGLTNGQKPIPKKVVEYGIFNSYCKVEVIGLTLTLWKNFDPDTAFVGKFSHGDTTAELHEEIRRIFEVPQDTGSRLWGGFSPTIFDPLESADRSTVTTGLYHKQIVVLEVQQSDGLWSYEYCRMRVIHDQDNKPTVSYPALPIDSGASCLTASPDALPSNVSECSVDPVLEDTNSVSRKLATKMVATPSLIPSTPVNTMQTRGARRADIRTDTGRVQQSTPGLCGLANLGNTCFMNAIIQCMSNCPTITNYFRSQRHLEELNTDNPLGMCGEIAKSYADLLMMMWSGTYSYALPHNFKQRVGAFAPSFSGYQQQDAQELLTFLLDGLHEDLNRIREKPYIELQDSNGRPDEEVAEEAWTNYLRRNDSIIVDNFHGLLKSTVVCPDCTRVSVTFDPFVYLSLPLPVVKERIIEFTVFFYDISKAMPIRYKLSVPILGSIGDMVTIVSGHCKVPADQLMVVQVIKSHFHRIFDSNQAISLIDDKGKIVLYELPKCSSDLDKFAVLPVCLWEASTQSNNGASNQLFGYPFVVVIARSQLSYKRIYEVILRKLKKFMSGPTDDNFRDGLLRFAGLEILGGEMAAVSTNDNHIGGDNVNEAQDANDQSLFTLFFAYDPDSKDMGMTPIPPDDNVLQLPVVIGRRSCVVGFSPSAKTRYYNDGALKNILFEDLSSSPSSDTLNLSECFQHYTVEEKLGVKDAWYCPNCKKHQCASKKFDLWHLPPILVIHLKRFSFTRYRRMKLDMMVNAPLVDMDLSEYVIGPNKINSTYNLIGVTNHSGTLGGGHYTASALNALTRTWHHFDDATVSRLMGRSPVSKGTYVLFYMRNDVYTEQMETD